MPDNQDSKQQPHQQDAPEAHDTGQPEAPIPGLAGGDGTKRKKKNLLLWESFGISAAIQIGILVLAGGYVVYETVIRDDTQFDEPPPEVVEEIPENVEVQIQKQAPRMNLSQRPLQIKSVGSISVANVTADVVAGVGESFQIGNVAVGGMGNLDIGAAAGSLGLGMSEINVFGITDKGERILFIIDAGQEMVDDKAGGLWSYQAIKDEITRLIGGLSPGALFNVILFDSWHGGRVETFQPQLVPATPENHAKFKQWIDPVNKDPKRIGVRRPNIRIEKFTDTPVGAALRRGGWQNGPMTISQIALEQNVDLVYVITTTWSGFQRINRAYTEQEEEAWTKIISDKKYIEQLKQHEKEMVEARRQLQARKQQIDAERKSQGLPPKIWHPNVYVQMRETGVTFKTPHPGHRPRLFIEQRDVENYFRAVVEELYTKKRARPPKVNVILFMAEDDEASSEVKSGLRSYTRFFGNGRFRELRGRKAIEAHQSGR